MPHRLRCLESIGCRARIPRDENYSHVCRLLGCGHDHNLGTSILEEIPDVTLFSEVKLLMCSNNEISEALPLERSDHGGTHQSTMSGDVDLCGLT